MSLDDVSGSSAAGAAPAGRLIAARYDVLEPLGEADRGGAPAELIASFRARDRSMNRIVAVKTLQPPFGEREEIAERLRVGLGRVLSLAHPNIVRTYDVGRDESDGEKLYLVEEFVRGIDLKERIRRAAPFQLAAATDVAMAIAEALAYAQTRGVSHGDVRPRNVLIGPDGLAKLTGFGVAEAQALARDEAPALLRQTVAYSAPESARDSAADPNCRCLRPRRDSVRTADRQPALPRRQLLRHRPEARTGPCAVAKRCQCRRTARARWNRTQGAEQAA